MKKISKSKITLPIIIILLLFTFLFLFYNFYKSLYSKINFETNVLDFAEKNDSTIFSIDKILFFSSCDSKNKNTNVSNLTLENLYAYTDIGIFINNNNINDLEHTLKSVKLSNIHFSKSPELGSPKICYKSLDNFAKSDYIEDSSIDSELNFNISSEDTTDLSLPTLYNNCANPITLTYINENIKTDYTILDTTSPITYNGSLLQRCSIPLASIDCSISFDIYIVNNKNENFKTSIYIDIPYKDDSKSIYDGTFTVKNATNILFYRYD